MPSDPNLRTRRRESWERQPSETILAYQAFCAYRDLGLERTLEKAAKILKRKMPGLQRWSAKHDWVRRAEEYDFYLEFKQRKKREKEYFQEIESYRKRQKQLASATIAAAVKLLQKASRKLDAVNSDDIDIKDLPNFFRSAASIAEAATNSEAQALALEELIQTYLQRKQDTIANAKQSIPFESKAG